MTKVNPIPASLIGFRVYLDGADMLGVADVELPDLEAITAEVTGAGIAGTVNVPILGHYDSMTLTLNWRALTGNVTILSAPKAHQLELRGSIQVYDAGRGENTTLALRVTTQVMPSKTGLGKAASGEPMESSGEFEVTYLKIVLADEPRVELDKLNYKCVIEGVDYLERVRGDLGL